MSLIRPRPAVTPEVALANLEMRLYACSRALSKDLDTRRQLVIRAAMDGMLDRRKVLVQQVKDQEVQP